MGARNSRSTTRIAPEEVSSKEQLHASDEILLSTTPGSDNSSCEDVKKRCWIPETLKYPSACDNNGSNCGECEMPASLKLDEQTNKDRQTSESSQRLKSELEDESISRRQNQRKVENMVHEEFKRDITDFYELHHDIILGSGNSGEVILCSHIETGIEYALKTLAKADVEDDPDALSNLKREIRILAELDHPYIIRLHECFEDDQYIRLVLELCRGGELYYRLSHQPDGRFAEHVACGYVHTMVSAIRYLHERNIAFRDLKLENFLFESEHEESQMKLIDFGLSRYFKENELMDCPVGTPYYLAPEVLAGAYTNKCDVWSIGVMAYMLLSGTPPFAGEDDMSTLRAVYEGKVEFDMSVFSGVSLQAKNFITACLTKDVARRPDASSLLHHEWFLCLADKEKPPSIEVVTRLVDFNKRSALFKLCMEVIAHTLTAEQISSLREQFNILDTEGTGEISCKDLQHMLEQYRVFVNATGVHHEVYLNYASHLTTMKYHEFLAAAFSREQITEGNMKVAFEKLSGHDDFVTVAHIRSLLGREANEQDVIAMMKEANLDPLHSRIDYKQFKTILYDGLGSPCVNLENGEGFISLSPA